jgi:hypothetical protein
MTLDAAAAQVVEQLRYGLPPLGRSRAFTVGRQEQLAAIARQLGCRAGTGLLIQADYGAGKSHLLHVIREMALDTGFAVGMVVVNAQEGVRFDRPETIFGAVCRRLEGDTSGQQGVATLFGSLTGPHPVLSSNGRWDYSEYLEAPAMYVALRAWLLGDAPTRLLVEDWLTNPGAYRDRRRYLYDALVYGLRDHFTDPRPEWKFHARELLVLQRRERSQVWPALGDLARIAVAGGRRGLVLLFDEVEDVVQNLPRIAQRQEAVDNLLRFFGPTLSEQQLPANRLPRLPGSDNPESGPPPPVHAFFAVTPDFIEQCRPYLPRLAPTDGAPLRLPALHVEAVRREELLELAMKIRQVHARAYHWDAEQALPDEELGALVGRLSNAPSAQRVRHSIQGVVQALDERLARMAQ